MLAEARRESKLATEEEQGLMKVAWASANVPMGVREEEVMSKDGKGWVGGVGGREEGVGMGNGVGMGGLLRWILTSTGDESTKAAAAVEKPTKPVRAGTCWHRLRQATLAMGPRVRCNIK